MNQLLEGLILVLALNVQATLIGNNFVMIENVAAISRFNAQCIAARVLLDAGTQNVRAPRRPF